MRNIVIGLSWPYANSNLHLGHVASSLPADVLARYHRMVGDSVMFVGGTDCHGNKPADKARIRGVKPIDIVNEYDANFRTVFSKMNFSFNLYAKTADPEHIKLVKPFFVKMYQNGYIVEREEMRPFCPKCNKYVQDNQIQIICPRCGATTKADNCDKCGYVPNEKDMENTTCLTCGGKCELKKNKVLVFKLSAFSDKLKKYLEDNKQNWRANAVGETEKYLKDLQDRDFSRDLEWGVDVPIDGYRDKKVYVWYEALLGYITDVIRVCEQTGQNWEDFWKSQNPKDRIYMVHAKDNITFHTLMLPAMIMAINENIKLPTHICSCEYLTNKGEKISKTKGGFEALPWIESSNPDSLRYFFISNGPENRDSDWSFDFYKTIHNTEVVNKLGNLINRTLKFKGLETLPCGNIDPQMKQKVKDTYASAAAAIETMEFKKALACVMDLVSEANKYYDDQKPWVQAKEEDKTAFNNTIFTCAYVVANLSNLLMPFMPTTAAKIKEFLALDQTANWTEVVPAGGIALTITPLFERLV